MEEKVLNGKKNGMLVLLGWLLAFVVAVAGLVFAAMHSWWVLLALCILWLALSWIILPGLKCSSPRRRWF